MDDDIDQLLSSLGASPPRRQNASGAAAAAATRAVPAVVAADENPSENDEESRERSVRDRKKTDRYQPKETPPPKVKPTRKPARGNDYHSLLQERLEEQGRKRAALRVALGGMARGMTDAELDTVLAESKAAEAEPDNSSSASATGGQSLQDAVAAALIPCPGTGITLSAAVKRLANVNQTDFLTATGPFVLRGAPFLAPVPTRVPLCDTTSTELSSPADLDASLHWGCQPVGDAVQAALSGDFDAGLQICRIAAAFIASERRATHDCACSCGAPIDVDATLGRPPPISPLLSAFRDSELHSTHWNDVIHSPARRVSGTHPRLFASAAGSSVAAGAAAGAALVRTPSRALAPSGSAAAATTAAAAAAAASDTAISVEAAVVAAALARYDPGSVWGSLKHFRGLHSPSLYNTCEACRARQRHSLDSRSFQALAMSAFGVGTGYGLCSRLLLPPASGSDNPLLTGSSVSGSSSSSMMRSTAISRSLLPTSAAATTAAHSATSWVSMLPTARSSLQAGVLASIRSGTGGDSTLLSTDAASQPLNSPSTLSHYWVPVTAYLKALLSSQASLRTAGGLNGSARTGAANSMSSKLRSSGNARLVDYDEEAEDNAGAASTKQTAARSVASAEFSLARSLDAVSLAAELLSVSVGAHAVSLAPAPQPALARLQQLLNRSRLRPETNPSTSVAAISSPTSSSASSAVAAAASSSKASGREDAQQPLSLSQSSAASLRRTVSGPLSSQSLSEDTQKSESFSQLQLQRTPTRGRSGRRDAPVAAPAAIPPSATLQSLWPYPVSYRLRTDIASGPSAAALIVSPASSVLPSQPLRALGSSSSGSSSSSNLVDGAAVPISNVAMWNPDEWIAAQQQESSPGDRSSGGRGGQLSSVATASSGTTTAAGARGPTRAPATSASASAACGETEEEDLCELTPVYLYSTSALMAAAEATVTMLADCAVQGEIPTPTAAAAAASSDEFAPPDKSSTLKGGPSSKTRRNGSRGASPPPEPSQPQQQQPLTFTVPNYFRDSDRASSTLEGGDGPAPESASTARFHDSSARARGALLRLLAVLCDVLAWRDKVEDELSNAKEHIHDADDDKTNDVAPNNAAESPSAAAAAAAAAAYDSVSSGSSSDPASVSRSARSSSSSSESAVVVSGPDTTHEASAFSPNSLIVDPGWAAELAARVISRFTRVDDSRVLSTASAVSPSARNQQLKQQLQSRLFQRSAGLKRGRTTTTASAAAGGPLSVTHGTSHLLEPSSAAAAATAAVAPNGSKGGSATAAASSGYAMGSALCPFDVASNPAELGAWLSGPTAAWSVIGARIALWCDDDPREAENTEEPAEAGAGPARGQGSGGAGGFFRGAVIRGFREEPAPMHRVELQPLPGDEGAPASDAGGGNGGGKLWVALRYRAVLPWELVFDVGAMAAYKWVPPPHLAGLTLSGLGGSMQSMVRAVPQLAMAPGPHMGGCLSVISNTMVGALQTTLGPPLPTPSLSSSSSSCGLPMPESGLAHFLTMPTGSGSPLGPRIHAAAATVAIGAASHAETASNSRSSGHGSSSSPNDADAAAAAAESTAAAGRTTLSSVPYYYTPAAAHRSPLALFARRLALVSAHSLLFSGDSVPARQVEDSARRRTARMLRSALARINKRESAIRAAEEEEERRQTAIDKSRRRELKKYKQSRDAKSTQSANWTPNRNKNKRKKQDQGGAFRPSVDEEVDAAAAAAGAAGGDSDDAAATAAGGGVIEVAEGDDDDNDDGTALLKVSPAVSDGEDDTAAVAAAASAAANVTIDTSFTPFEIAAPSNSSEEGGVDDDNDLLIFIELVDDAMEEEEAVAAAVGMHASTSASGELKQLDASPLLPTAESPASASTVNASFNSASTSQRGSVNSSASPSAASQQQRQQLVRFTPFSRLQPPLLPESLLEEFSSSYGDSCTTTPFEVRRGRSRSSSSSSSGLLGETAFFTPAAQSSSPSYSFAKTSDGGGGGSSSGVSNNGGGGGGGSKSNTGTTRARTPPSSFLLFPGGIGLRTDALTRLASNIACLPPRAPCGTAGITPVELAAHWQRLSFITALFADSFTLLQSHCAPPFPRRIMNQVCAQLQQQQGDGDGGGAAAAAAAAVAAQDPSAPKKSFESFGAVWAPAVVPPPLPHAHHHQLQLRVGGNPQLQLHNGGYPLSVLRCLLPYPVPLQLRPSPEWARYLLDAYLTAWDVSCGGSDPASPVQKFVVLVLRPLIHRLTALADSSITVAGSGS